jgi:hypothetical protein
MLRGMTAFLLYINIATQILCFVVLTIAVTVRLFVRHHVVKKLGVEDSK